MFESRKDFMNILYIQTFQNRYIVGNILQTIKQY